MDRFLKAPLCPLCGRSSSGGQQLHQESKPGGRHMGGGHRLCSTSSLGTEEALCRGFSCCSCWESRWSSKEQDGQQGSPAEQRRGRDNQFTGRLRPPCTGKVQHHAWGRAEARCASQGPEAPGCWGGVELRTPPHLSRFREAGGGKVACGEGGS